MTVDVVIDSLAVVIAVIAALIALISLKRTDRFNVKQLEFQQTADRLNQLLIDRERDDSTAQKRAELSANLVKLGRSDFKLKVFNRGRAPAHNVRLLDLDAAESILIASDIDENFPVPILMPQQSVTLIAALDMQSATRAHIKLIWDDAVGDGHELELTPTL